MHEERGKLKVTEHIYAFKCLGNMWCHLLNVVESTKQQNTQKKILNSQREMEREKRLINRGVCVLVCASVRLKGGGEIWETGGGGRWKPMRCSLGEKTKEVDIP
jgi:hypothetical protein